MDDPEGSHFLWNIDISLSRKPAGFARLVESSPFGVALPPPGGDCSPRGRVWPPSRGPDAGLVALAGSTRAGSTLTLQWETNQVRWTKHKMVDILYSSLRHITPLFRYNLCNFGASYFYFGWAFKQHCGIKFVYLLTIMVRWWLEFDMQLSFRQKRKGEIFTHICASISKFSGYKRHIMTAMMSFDVTMSQIRRLVYKPISDS